MLGWKGVIWGIILNRRVRENLFKEVALWKLKNVRKSHMSI